MVNNYLLLLVQSYRTVSRMTVAYICVITDSISVKKENTLNPLKWRGVR